MTKFWSVLDKMIELVWKVMIIIGGIALIVFSVRYLCGI